MWLSQQWWKEEEEERRVGEYRRERREESFLASPLLATGGTHSPLPPLTPAPAPIVGYSGYMWTNPLHYAKFAGLLLSVRRPLSHSTCLTSCTRDFYTFCLSRLLVEFG